jgi:hypothetical protein
MFTVKTFVNNGTIVIYLYDPRDIMFSTMIMGIEVPEINVDNVNNFKMDNNDISYYINIKRDIDDIGYFNAYILNKNKDIISNKFSISSFNANIYQINLFTDSVKEELECSSHKVSVEQVCSDDTSLSTVDNDESSCKLEEIKVNHNINATMDLNEKIKRLKQQTENKDTTKDSDSTKETGIKHISYASIAKQPPKEESIVKKTIKEFTPSIDIINKYERLQDIFKKFMEENVKNSPYDSIDFKKYLKNNNLSDFIPLLEYNMEVVEFYENIKNYHSDNPFPKEPFFEWASNYLYEKYPEYGVIFGEYSTKGLEYKKYIVYNIRKRNSIHYPNLQREQDFYEYEKNRAIQIISSHINKLDNDFEPFEFKDIGGVGCMYDLFFTRDVKDGILEKLEDHIRDTVFINFRVEYPMTPLVDYRK